MQDSKLPRLMHILLFIFAFVTIFELSENADNRALRDYDRKICFNEPSCHLMNETPSLPKNRYTLKKRDCMCDSACVEYRDCCSDSLYYEVEEQNSSPLYSCSSSEKVYMKVNCPENTSNKDVSNKCAESLNPLTSTDVALYIPVTNPVKNVTYGNRYCALCHGDTKYKVWNEFPSCGEVPEEFLTSDRTIKDNARLSINFRKYRNEASTIWKNVSYYHQGSGYFISNYNNKVFVCRMYRGLPKELDKNVRPCVPNVIETCSEESDSTEVQKCNSYTSIVYQKGGQKKKYRNIDCAKCNGVSSTDVTGCPVTLKDQ